MSLEPYNMGLKSFDKVEPPDMERVMNLIYEHDEELFFQILYYFMGVNYQHKQKGLTILRMQHLLKPLIREFIEFNEDSFDSPDDMYRYLPNPH